jgi:hypothetical protein
LPVLCADIRTNPDTNDCLLTTWNVTPHAGDQIASIQGNSVVGNPVVVMNNLPAGGIPGFATYFWFIPAQSVLATVRFHHTHNGHQGLDMYLNGTSGLCIKGNWLKTDLSSVKAPIPVLTIFVAKREWGELA